MTPAVCSNGLLPNQLMDTRYTDFAPRFGIAYSPDSKTVIRTGFGMFFSQDNANSAYFDLARNLAVRNSNIANHRGLRMSNITPAMPTPFLTTGGIDGAGRGALRLL